MTITTERRSFIQGAGLVAAAASATLVASPTFAQTNQPSGAKTMPYQAKPMSLDPKSIKGISEKVLVSHYENNYVGAVKRLNAIGAQLAELDFAKAPNFMINGLKREELVAANSMILHEIYFDGLGGGAGASGALAEAIARDFGSLERWRTEFAAMGKAEGGGSGWVILSYSPRDKRLVNQWAAHHDTGRRPAGAGARHVRARLSHGLWCSGRALRRHLYGGDPLGQRRKTVRSVQRRKLMSAVRDTLHKDARSARS
jgi:superoxide dismutase, Fe-Mn family